MNNAQLKGIREIHHVLDDKLEDYAVVELDQLGKIEIIRAFQLARERAEIWLEFFPHASVLTMKETMELLQ